MEMNTQAHLGPRAVPSLPTFSQAAITVPGLPDTQTPKSSHPLARLFVANAQRLASFEDAAGFVALKGILKCAALSKSSAYKDGIVPMYDDLGHLKPNDKTPTHPWLRLPEPVIKTGKKRWATEDIAAWFVRMGIAANQGSDSQTIVVAIHGEVKS